MAAHLVADQDRTGGGADCIVKLRHDGIVYVEKTVIDPPADNATGRSAYGQPAGTAVIGTCNDDGSGEGTGRAGGAVTFPADGARVDVVELTDVAPTMAVVRPQSDGSGAVFVAVSASEQQIGRIFAKLRGPAAELTEHAPQTAESPVGRWRRIPRPSARDRASSRRRGES